MHGIPFYIFWSLVNRHTHSCILKGRHYPWWEEDHMGLSSCRAIQICSKQISQVSSPEGWKWPSPWKHLDFSSQVGHSSQDWTIRSIRKGNQSHFTHKKKRLKGRRQPRAGPCLWGGIFLLKWYHTPTPQCKVPQASSQSHPPPLLTHVLLCEDSQEETTSPFIRIINSLLKMRHSCKKYVLFYKINSKTTGR